MYLWDEALWMCKYLKWAVISVWLSEINTEVVPGCVVVVCVFVQSVKKQQYRFSVIMNELHNTDNVPYMVTLMSVVNVLVFGQKDLRKRERVRQEFIGMTSLTTLTNNTQTMIY